MTIEITNVPKDALNIVREIAAEQGQQLRTPSDYKRYLMEDEEALEVVLPYIDF